MNQRIRLGYGVVLSDVQFISLCKQYCPNTLVIKKNLAFLPTDLIQNILDYLIDSYYHDINYVYNCKYGQVLMFVDDLNDHLKLPFEFKVNGSSRTYNEKIPVYFGWVSDHLLELESDAPSKSLNTVTNKDNLDMICTFMLRTHPGYYLLADDED